MAKKSSFWKTILGEEGLDEPITYRKLLKDIVWIVIILFIMGIIAKLFS